MGRSVSSPSRAFTVVYQDCSDFGYEELEGRKEYEEVLGAIDWDFFISETTLRALALFPSFVDCDEWLGIEDHAILENQFAYFGISEYCGLVSLWLVLKEDLERDSLAQYWAKQVTPKFEKNFGDLKRIGTMSNGESVYKKKGETK